MKFLEVKLLFVLILAAIISSSATAQLNAGGEKMDVLVYYKLIPNNTLNNDEIHPTVEISDPKNGYLKITGAFAGRT